MSNSVGMARQYRVWDRGTRWFHWINVLCVLILTAFGMIVLFAKDLGLTSAEEIPIKTLHVYVGYIFALNIVWRVIWAFIGNEHARWKALLPVGKGFATSLRDQIVSLRTGRVAVYLGHSPLGRIMILLLLLLMVVQLATGLVLAGTDLYMPPFGSWIANWVTDGDPARLALLQPGSQEHVISEAYSAMRAFRLPFKETHEIGFYVLALAVVVHVAANIAGDVRNATGQISAMFSGIKTLAGVPKDGDQD